MITPSATARVPACLGYRGYRHTLCTSINHVVCHGIPGDKPLRDGDIVNIDVTVILDGWHGDTSRMYLVGDVKRKAAASGRDHLRIHAARHRRGEARRHHRRYRPRHPVLCRRSRNIAPWCAISAATAWARVFHALPNIVHYGKPGHGIGFKPGMFFTIEPMINLGGYGVKVLNDGWTAVTRDRSLSAQFEHSVGVTEDGVEIFTLSPKGWHKPPYL